MFGVTAAMKSTCLPVARYSGLCSPPCVPCCCPQPRGSSAGADLSGSKHGCNPHSRPCSNQMPLLASSCASRPNVLSMKLFHCAPRAARAAGPNNRSCCCSESSCITGGSVPCAWATCGRRRQRSRVQLCESIHSQPALLGSLLLVAAATALLSCTQQA